MATSRSDESTSDWALSPKLCSNSPPGEYWYSPLGLDGAYRIVIDSTGLIFITEQNTNRITKFQIDLATPAMPLTFGRLKATYR